MLIKNRYEILNDLAEGGFGKTFVAKDIDWHDRRCVVKQLRVASDHPDFAYVQNKFRQEAKVLDSLAEAIDQIPALRNQIPKLYAYFTEANLFYLVQQWIPGKTLAEQVKVAVLDEQQVRQFLIDILPVLQMIHDRGIIHRDIKPSNLIMRESDGKPVLIDFGAVKELAEIAAHPDTYFYQTSESGSVSYSEPTTGIGTPGFMAPEQETCEPVYPCTDLYSLGITAIYALSGQIFRGSHTGKARWRFFSDRLSEEFSAVLDKAIQPDPFERYASAQEMLLAIQRLPPLVDPTVEALKTTRLDPPKPTRRTPSQRLRLRPFAFSGMGLVTAITIGLHFNNRLKEADLDRLREADLQKIGQLQQQGEYQACIVEAKKFAQVYTLSALNPTTKAEQLANECVTALAKNIATAKANGDYTACINTAKDLLEAQFTPDSNLLAQIRHLENECKTAADLQNYLRIDVPQRLEEIDQTEIAKIIAKIQPHVQIDQQTVIISYDGAAHPEFANNAGLKNLTAFFISALCGQSKEFPTTKYADFSRMIVSLRGKPITATVTKAKWDTYLRDFKQASSTAQQESIKKQFIEQIQVSSS